MKTEKPRKVKQGKKHFAQNRLRKADVLFSPWKMHRTTVPRNISQTACLGLLLGLVLTVSCYTLSGHDLCLSVTDFFIFFYVDTNRELKR